MRKPTLPSDPLAATIAYYDGHAEEFIDRTANISMEQLYEPFLTLVPAAGHILDAGCGSGRDAAEFTARGYGVTAFDGSEQIAKLASQRTGLPVLHLSFDAVDWQEEFDGVWACASLLHIPSALLPSVLARLRGALRPAGVLYMSFKSGGFEGEREGRWFTDADQGRLAKLLDGHGLEVIRIWNTDDARRGARLTWTNTLARRAISPPAQ